MEVRAPSLNLRDIMANWPILFGMFIFTLYIGASILVSEAMSNWGILLAFACIYWLIRNGVPKVSRLEWVMFGVFYAYYFFFLWRSIVSPFRGEDLIFFRENFVFLYMPLIILTLRKMDIEKILENISRLIIPVMLIALVWALYEFYILGVKRVELYAANTLSLAMYAIASVHFSFTNWRNRTPMIWFGYAMVWGIGFFIVFYLTQSRNATALYMLCAVLFLAYALYRPEKGLAGNLPRFLILGLIALVFMAVAIIAIIYLGYGVRLERLLNYIITGEASFDKSTFYRVKMWSGFFENIDAVGWFGIGPDYTMGIALEAWPDTPFKHLHNDLFSLYAAGGYVGIAFYIILVFWPLFYLAKKETWQPKFIYLAMLLFTIMFVSGLTNRVFFHQERSVWYLFCLSFVHIYFMQLTKKRTAH